ncbi:MAG: 3-dehydroquinate synthase [Candidatus Eisenbacteria bacterium]|uniref:3-dehydroquinate synthase n=1 Tax=Eiseniibacteriota bacterium TaxID=2212470 RepID=A0A538SDN7_UNCEI|nr:MAG: 3-dehydroquinate synthase [Candidatus Eisenbacteria bacterium]
MVVSDSTVAALHGPLALRSLRRSGVAAELVTVPHGERSKSLRHLERLWAIFAELGLDRGGAVVALGGGVVGDLAGFAAATWLRGVPWVCVPTTVLAQVDSSIGGKTAVDLPHGKNLVGAFHQPAGVLVDPAILGTLPDRQLRAGLAEAVKTGMAVDGPLFLWLERHVERLLAGSPEALGEAVTRSLRAKARVVRADEREGGRRAALNYGHTLGHALEAAGGYRGLLHGEAVAIGMRVAAGLSVRFAGLPPAARRRQDALLDSLRLPGRIPGTPLAKLLDAMSRDKKRRDGKIRWVLTPRMGHASVPRLISARWVEAALIEAGARA